MLQRLIALFAVAFFVAACETASQTSTDSAGDTTASSTSSTASASGSSSTASTASSGSASSGSAAGSTTSPADTLATIGNTVYFSYDSAALDGNSKGSLFRQAAFLNANPTLTVTIEGHCDERGTREYNLAMGERRAAAARDYLLAQGVDPARIKVISYGKERPAMAGSNEESWANNRRAATVLN